ncbi:hypothetical protein JCM19992_20800 [Thermostilla marina]
MNRRIVFFMAVTALGLLLPSAVASAEVGSAADEPGWIALLQSDAPKSEKAITCKKLAVWGSGKAVPALAELLPDPELSSWARIALEAIPDPAADAALRDAAQKLHGRVLIGVINSIGVRRDADAVGVLSPLLQAQDSEVASAAAVALGKIGNNDAIAALRSALGNTEEPVRSSVAEGLILAAEQAWKAGDLDTAAELYDLVRNSDVADVRRAEGLFGAIVARKSAGIPLLVEQLKTGDRRAKQMALAAARELQGEGVARALLSQLDQIPENERALLVIAIADRADPDALPVIRDLAGSTQGVVQLAAIDYLKRAGDDSCLDVLIRIAVCADAPAAEAAVEAMAALPKGKVDAEIESRLKTAEGKERLVLIRMVGRRLIPAVELLKAAASDPDPAISTAALTSLGQIADFDDLSLLIDRALQPRSDKEGDIALKALRTACLRMADRDACAKQLAAAAEKASIAGRIALMEILAEMGGPVALEAMAAAAKSPEQALQDAATRLLGGWMSVDAGPVLLEIAKQKGPYQVRALRGYIRLIRQFDMDDAARVSMCRAALAAATRKDEVLLVFDAAQRYPSLDMLRLVVHVAKNADVRKEATAAAMQIAQQLPAAAEVTELLQEVGYEPVKLEILEARYGAEGKEKDVTAVVQKAAKDMPLIVLPSASYNQAFGGDPVPGVVKELRIRYRMNGREGEATFRENATILLPIP